ncbi:hypothetical protein P171DRAFT_340712, partial [Karstenula rhodostoma CBS 690.94]
TGGDLKFDFALHDPLAIGNMDVINITKHGNEDVYHLRRRGSDQCDEIKNDCLTYSGWTADDQLPCKEGYVVQRSPEKRNPKKNWICLGDYKMIYDIGDPSDPTKAEWYQLKRYERRWSQDVDATRGERCYDAEHVLEWSLLLKFLQEDRDKKDGHDSLCTLMWKYYSKQNMPKESIPVRKAKDYQKVLDKGEHFDYEWEYFKFSKFRSEWYDRKGETPIKEPRPIDWIGMQWPGKDKPKSKPPTPWEYELVVLSKEFNVKKNNVWDNENILPVPDYEPGTTNLKKTQANSDTLEALYANQYFEGGEEKTWPENRGKCKAIYKFTTLMSLVGLKDAWFEWMKKVHKDRLEKLNKILEEKVNIFKDDATATSRFKRWDFFGIFRRKVEKPQCGSETDDKKVLQRVELMLDAYDRLGKVDTELSLD